VTVADKNHNVPIGVRAAVAPQERRGNRKGFYYPWAAVSLFPRAFTENIHRGCRA
jgi:hypothetical protein